MEKVKITFPDEIKKPLIINGSKFISLFDLSLTEKEIVKANKELSETKEKKEKCIKKLRDKLAEDEDATYRTDEEYLLSYLRVRKFDWSKAYENIRAASIFRKKNPEILKIPPNLESLLKLNLTLYSPYVDENGNLIMLFDVEKWNDKEMSFNEVMQMCTCMHDIILMNPRCQINGLVVIWDVKGISVRHVTNVLRNTTFGTLAYYLQNYYAIRLKHAYFINTSRLSQLIFKMARPFLAKKIAERVVFFGSDLKELHQVVNPALLPRTFGGSLEEDQCSVVYEMILRNVRYLKYVRSYF